MSWDFKVEFILSLYNLHLPFAESQVNDPNPLMSLVIATAIIVESFHHHPKTISCSYILPFDVFVVITWSLQCIK